MAAIDPIVPVSAPPSPLNGELTPEERKSRLEEVRRRMSMSTLTVSPPAGWVIRWARHVDAADIARLEYKGYQIVHDDPRNPRYKTAVRIREDGTYMIGDVILMEIPQEVWEFLREQETEKATQMVQAAESDFIERAHKEGVPTFERDAKGRVVKEHT